MKKQLQDFKNNTFIEIEYDEENGWIYNRWSGLITMNDIKKGALACLEVLEEKKVKVIVNDHTKLITKWDSINDWLAKEWIPRAMESGLECFAHVVNPIHHIGESAAMAMKERVAENFRMEIFHTIDDAKYWIENHECKD
ncbi:MAG: hypothetical protein V4642_03745 [Bacteroidota bacterium]